MKSSARPSTMKSQSNKSAQPAAAAQKQTSATTVNYRQDYRGAKVTQIDAIEYDSLTPAEFYTRYVAQRRPVLLRPSSKSGEATVDEFAALRRHWLSTHYLRQVAGETQVRVEWKVDEKEDGEKTKKNLATSFGRGQHEWMSFNHFLDHLQGKPPANSTHAHHSLYLTSQPIASREDGSPMELCAEPLTSLLADMPLRPSILELLIPVQYNTWIGGYRGAPVANVSQTPTASFKQHSSPFHRSPGTTSGLHHDYHDNIYALLSGHKTFHLFPPSDAPSMYTHGMNPASEEGDEDAERGCRIHPNGVIEYCDASELNDEQDATSKNITSDQRKATQAKQQKLLKEMEDELKEEEEEGEESDADPSADPSLLDDSDASARALFASKCTALTDQIKELESAWSKVVLNLKFETIDKRKKHLTNEKTGLEKKLAALKQRVVKTKEEEDARIKEFEANKLKVKADDAMNDGEDGDDDSFPADMHDDYEGSDDDQMDDDEEAALMEDDDEDDEDDDDEDDIDPEEKAAWMKFMAESAAKSKSKKNGNKNEPQPVASKKRKEVSSTTAAASKSQSSKEPPAKKSKTSATTSSTTTPAPDTTFAQSYSTPSSIETFPDNFSRIDFSKLTQKEIQQQFPLFGRNCRPFVVDVREGEMLYLPASWFHEVFSCSTKSPDEEDVDSDRLAPSVHFALNYWYQPPTTPSFNQPYDQTDRDCELRFKNYYFPRITKLKTAAEFAAKKVTKPLKQKSSSSSTTIHTISTSSKQSNKQSNTMTNNPGEHKSKKSIKVGRK